MKPIRIPSLHGRAGRRTTAGVLCALLPALLAALLTSACGGGNSAPTPLPATKALVAQVSTASALPAGCGAATGSNADAYTADSAVQPQLAAGPAASATLYGLWEQDRWNAIGTRAINFSRSADGGATWGAISALPFSACGGGGGAAYDRASDPSIAVGSGGVLYASALAFSAGNYLASGGVSAVLVSRSSDGGITWQAPITAKLDTGSAGGPWYFNDRDAIAADPASPNVYLVWDRLTTNTSNESIPTWLLHSGDGGAHWDAAKIIYNPPVLTQTFNNQPLVLPDGSVVVVFTLINGFGNQLAAIRSTDHGTSWTAAAATIATLQPLGTRNPISGGPPIRDSSYMAQTAVDPVNGTLAAVWQDSRFSGGARDGIALSLSIDAGTTWSAPRQINLVAGVAAFDPAVHFGSGGRIAVTYYDLRDYLAGSSVLDTSLWLVESTDGGATWTEARLYGPFDLNKAPPADQSAGTTGKALFLGDQQGLAWNGAGWAAFNAATVDSGSRVFATRLP
jgi:Neuraminidase (sialidase)